ncbi:MAG: outer membrane beta-barrel protein [Lysobacter sp.]
MPKAALSLALLAAIPVNSNAFDVDYEIGLAAKRSDNINLSEFDPVSDTVLSPQLRFEIDQDGPRVQMAARGDAQYLHYTSDTFDDEINGTFAGKLNVRLVPDRIDYVFQDYLSRQPVDELEPFTPTNEQQANVFVTGPSFYARFNSTTRSQLDLRYTNSYAEENEAFNGDRYDAAFRLLHELSATQTASANLEATKAEFDDVGNASDYAAYDAYVGYIMNRKAIDAGIDLGYSRLEPSNNGRRVSSALVRATVDWRLTPRSVLTTTLRHQLTDATQALINPSLELDRRGFSDFRYLDVGVRPNPYRERFVRMRYQYTGDRLTVGLVPYYRRVRYIDDLPESQDRRGVLAEIELRLRPRLNLSVLAAAENREYVDLDREDDDLSVSVGLVNRFTRHWTGRIDVQRRERDSSAFGRSYDANAVIVTLSYRR